MVATSPTTVETDFAFPHKGLVEFAQRGEHPDFGRYTSFGEVLDLKTGDALGVLTDQDGDQIVGLVKVSLEPDDLIGVQFSWRTSVQLSDGQRYVNTGKFANQTPPGLKTKELNPVLVALILIILNL